MNTTERIKSYLSRNHSASVYEISRALDLTKADIHYHIRSLLSDGVIAAREPGPTGSAGRPARRFELVEIPPLATTRLVVSHLLDETSQSAAINVKAGSLADRLALKILSCCPSSQTISYSPSIKLNRIVNELEPLGFSVRWEAGQNGPMIHIDREPLSMLITDKKLVRWIKNALVKRMVKITA